MDHTTLIVIFLAAVSVAVTINTLMMLGAYKGFSVATTKVSQLMREFETNTSAKQWIDSLDKAAAQTVAITETTKQKMAEFEPVLDNLQDRYNFMLAKVDRTVERLADSASETAARMRAAVTSPAEKMDVVTDVLHKAVNFISSADAMPKP